MKTVYCLKIGMLGLFLALMGGCTSIEDPLSPGKVLWKLHGTVSNPDDSLKPTKLRAALVWLDARRQDQPPRFVQDVAITPVFPAHFAIELTKLPPKEAVQTGVGFDDGSQTFNCNMAEAQLIIYEDKNANSKLDFVPFEADKTIDRVLGPKESYRIIYVESVIKEVDDSGYKKKCSIGNYRPGINVIKWDVIYRQGTSVLDKRSLYDQLGSWVCVGEPSTPGYSPVCEVTVDDVQEVLSKDKVLKLTLEDDPRMQWRSCEFHCYPPNDAGGADTWCTDGWPEEVFEYVGWLPIEKIATDSEFFCYDQGYTLAFKTMIDFQLHAGGKICGKKTEKYIYGKSSITADQPIPETWPCKMSE